MKTIFTFLFIFSFYFVYSQHISKGEFPANTEVGKCYTNCLDKDCSVSYWLEIPCSIVYNKEKQVNYVKSIQYNLINNGFSDVKPTGYLDSLTVHYHNNLKKLLRKRKRKLKREKKNKKTPQN